MTFSPIVILCYNRPAHLKKVLSGLLIEKEISRLSSIYIFVDAVKDKKDLEKQAQVVEIAFSVKGFLSVSVELASSNQGIKKSALKALKQVSEIHGKVIYLEDDTVPQNGFLKYMNKALEFYRDCESVYSISGYSLAHLAYIDVDQPYFSHRFAPWGFGTWYDRIKTVDFSSPKAFLKMLNPIYFRRFNRDSYGWGYTFLAENLFPFLKKYTQSWDISFFYHYYNLKYLSVSPAQNYIENIGFDGSGEHAQFNKVTILEKAKISKNEEFSFPLCGSLVNFKLIKKISRKILPIYRKKSFASFFKIIKIFFTRVLS